MLTFLFWNLDKRDISNVVVEIVLENKVDILLLAENTIPPSRLLHLLNPIKETRFNFVPPPLVDETKIDIFFGFAPEFLQPQRDTRRATIRSVKLPGRKEFLLCGVHFQSLAVWNEQDQALEAKDESAFKVILKEIFADAKTTRVIQSLLAQSEGYVPPDPNDF